jgi:class 3 adenylate cyclase
MEKRLLQRYLPRELPAHVAGGNPGRAERLWLTVAFIDLVGFTQATRMLPAEILSCLLNDFFSAVNEHVERHAGSVSKFLGDGVLCVFAPLGVEQRGSTASGCVTCLSELPDLMGRLRRRWRSEGYLHGFTVTAGVASGFCALGDWGSDQRLDYTVIGEPVNLARRLQGVAGDCGGVLIDAVTAELVRPLADVGEEYCLDLKGMDATVGFAPLPSEPNLC